MKTKIIVLTSDAYGNLAGYSLVFMKLFTYISDNYNHVDVVLYSNDGLASEILRNSSFKKYKLSPKRSLPMKLILLTLFFVKNIYKYKRDSVIISNAEIPELLAIWILKIKFKKTYCFIQDIRVRDGGFIIKSIMKFRIFLALRVGNIIFTNKFTMQQFNDKHVNKFYIGNPIF